MQEISLTAGWNWVSFYVEAEDLLEQLEAGLGESGIQIKYRNTVTAWDEDEEEWAGSLQAVGITNDKTYLIQTSAACQVTLVGAAAVTGECTIRLQPGWNWIGFPSAVAVDVNTALAGLEAIGGDQIKSRNQVTAWDEDEEEWSGTLNVLTPGQGLMFYSASDAQRTFTFQTATGSRAGARE